MGRRHRRRGSQKTSVSRWAQPAGSRAATSSTCGSSPRCGQMPKKSSHWLDKLAGPITRFCSTRSATARTSTVGTRPRQQRTGGRAAISRRRSILGYMSARVLRLTNFEVALEPTDAEQALRAIEGPVHLRLPRTGRGRARARAGAGADRRHPEVPARAGLRVRLLRTDKRRCWSAKRSSSSTCSSTTTPSAAFGDRPEGRKVSARARLEDELLPQRRRRAAPARR